MRKQLYIPFIIFSFLGLTLKGQWREHLSYQNTLQVIRGDKIYAATTAALFSVDNTQEINRYHKVNGLSDIGVQQIGWDSQTEQLIIAYKNSNLDILKGVLLKI